MRFNHLKRSRALVSLSLLAMTATALLPAAAKAMPITLSTWNIDSTPDGQATGSLGSTALNFTTLSRSGIVVFTRWDDVPGFGSFIQFSTGATQAVSAGYDSAANPAVQTFSIGAPITNPTLLIGSGRPETTVDLTGLSPTFIAGNNAALNGQIVSFPNSTGLRKDAIALTVPGTFGPGSPLQFSVSSTSSALQDLRVSLGSAIPEPTSLAVVGAGAVALLVRRRGK